MLRLNGSVLTVLHFVYREQTIKCHCSLVCGLWHLLTGSLSQNPGHSLTDSQPVIRAVAVVLLMSAVCGQVFLAVCGSVEFLSFLPSPARTGRGDWPLCPSGTARELSKSACTDQTPPGAAEEALP